MTEPTTNEHGHAHAHHANTPPSVINGIKSKIPPQVLKFLNVQFAWFMGHVFAFLGAIFYSLFSMKIFKSPNFPLFWYKEAYISTIFTFGIIIYTTYKNKRVSPEALIRDDNIHYLLVAVLWLLSKPYFATLPPFMIFSLFHILTYTRSYILPTLGYSNSSIVSQQIQSFIKNYNDVFMGYAANFEFVLTFLLLVQFISFRKGTTFPFLFYLIFIKVRYDQSFYMKSVVRSWEVKADTIVSHPNLPPIIKNGWIQVKDVIKRITGAITISKPITKKQS